MFVCPTCGKAYPSEAVIAKHFLACWKERNPYHQSKPAPRSATLVIREDDTAAVDFFSRLGGKND